MTEPQVPCAYKPCVSFRSQKSWMGYCAIHHQVATDYVLFNQALRGGISLPLKEFALEVNRGAYPKGFTDD